MKFGVREICSVVLKAKATQKVGNKIFYPNEPVLYFDTLKTSSLEGAATTTYATGGAGNARLMAWEGERTLTFTMEDALMSPEGFMILSGAGLIDADENHVIYQHIVESTDDVTLVTEDNKSTLQEGLNKDSGAKVTLQTGDVLVQVEKAPYLPAKGKENFAYIMLSKKGEAASEPFIPEHKQPAKHTPVAFDEATGKYAMVIHKAGQPCNIDGSTAVELGDCQYTTPSLKEFTDGCAVIVDYYTAKTSNAHQVDITPDKFGGNYYLEASTLFRNTEGVDLPAEFVIPNCKVQSNFTFSMSSTGDPSTFTFTLDAFPDYTRFDKTHKVLAEMQVIDPAGAQEDLHRTATVHAPEHDKAFK